MHTHMCLEAQEIRSMKKSWDTIFIVMSVYIHIYIFGGYVVAYAFFFFCEANILKIKGQAWDSHKLRKYIFSSFLLFGIQNFFKFRIGWLDGLECWIQTR